MPRYFASKRHGTWHVGYQDTYWSDPISVTQYWPAIRGQFLGYLEEGDPLEGGHLTFFTVARGIPYQRPELTIAGDVQAIDRTEEPFPCPKTRKGTQTRYLQGRWQKLMAKGWKDITF